MITTKYFFLLVLIAAGLVFVVLFHWFASSKYGSEERLFVHYDSDTDRLLESKVHHWQTMSNQRNTALSALNFDEQLIVIYNRVPKTGSTSLVNLTYDLCRKNAFHVLHVNISANMHVMSLPNQIRFARNVTAWEAMKPAFYHGHLAYLDFSKLGIPAPKPLYINLIRKPLDRLVSYYYFLRYGDDYRPHLVRHRAGDTMTFDECVARQKPDCDPTNMWLQIPFFCGHAAECWKPGSTWALEEAKRNLVNEYFLVGVTEEMTEFVDLLELALPRLYRGASEHFLKSNKSHLRKTKSKIDPQPETVASIQQSTVWQMENELYEFALEQFHFVQKKLRTPGKSGMQDFFYEKIKPNQNVAVRN
ncbi:heparin sulfate O-sulfotransferase [Toxorhynchites rutilus septentrionalis]|uniref:heparin sulfate O-sulfotransferase n=1 Tax=Toxorhynchites rutilus septentrionalis TaxID=329112 RepID=UPI00247A15D2|nr:heparin sulfate O-sulfotransferase [Toxorhynchites rutilus septentrionalis]